MQALHALHGRCHAVLRVLLYGGQASAARRMRDRVALGLAQRIPQRIDVPRVLCVLRGSASAVVRCACLCGEAINLGLRLPLLRGRCALPRVRGPSHWLWPTSSCTTRWFVLYTESSVPASLDATESARGE